MISMKKVNYAAIDIGSNAVRLLIKCVNEENAPELMSKVQLIRIPLRLGEDAFTAGIISAEKEKKLIRLMKAYKQLMKIYDVVDYRACATSAMRDARNGKAIVRQIAQKTGIRVDIIDGQEEAAFAAAERYIRTHSKFDMRKLKAHLYARGFNGDDISAATARVEEEYDFTDPDENFD